MKKHIALIIVLSFSAAMGCSRPDPIHEPEGKTWEVNEPAAPQLEPPTPVSPDESSDERLVFEPGKLPWAKPDHRVVVHLEAEARALMEVAGLAPYWELPHFDPEYYATREGGIHHQLRFEYSAYYLQKLPTPRNANGDGWPRFRGVYLPSSPSDTTPPTLHLFEVGDDRHEAWLYMFDDNLVQIRAGYILHIHIPRTSELGAWVLCQHVLDHKVAEKRPDESGCGMALDEETSYEQVFLYGEDPGDQTDEQVRVVSHGLQRSYWKIGRQERSDKDDSDFDAPAPLFTTFRHGLR